MHISDFIFQTAGSKLSHISKEERLILETEILVNAFKEFKVLFTEKYKGYFHLYKLSIETEDDMIEFNFVRSMINDILLSEDYSLEGIAYYTQTNEDVICDLMIGKNSAPSFPLAYKIINLHRLVRPNLYKEIMQKITNEYLSKYS